MNIKRLVRIYLVSKEAYTWNDTFIDKPIHIEIKFIIAKNTCIDIKVIYHLHDVSHKL